MLKLEKIAKTLEINITLRERERFFNKALMQALSFAFGLHLLAFLLFHIQFIKIIDSPSAVIPALVEADFAMTSDNTVLAITEEEGNYSRHFIETKESKPLLPTFHLCDPASEALQINRSCEWKSDPFSQMESQSNAVVIPLPKPVTGWIRSLNVAILGSLSDFCLLSEDWKRMDLTSIRNFQNYRVLFSVLVDPSSGMIYWYEWITEKIHRDLDGIAEEILKNLRFTPGENLITTCGEVEISFQKDFHD